MKRGDKDDARKSANVRRRLTGRFKLDGDVLTIQFELGATSDPKITRTLCGARSRTEVWWA